MLRANLSFVVRSGTLFLGRNLDDGRAILLGVTTAGRDTRRSADVITDFDEGVDLLAFRAIDAREGRPGKQAFEFIDDADFDRAGQIRVTEAGGDTFVELNTRGRDGAEAMVRLEGSVALTEDSFFI